MAGWISLKVVSVKLFHREIVGHKTEPQEIRNGACWVRPTVEKGEGKTWTGLVLLRV